MKNLEPRLLNQEAGFSTFSVEESARNGAFLLSDYRQRARRKGVYPAGMTLLNEEVFLMSYDFAPLFRTAIGFDRLAQVMDTAARNTATPSYPPYDIAKTGNDSYALTMAVAGFGPDDIELVVQDNTLVVSGRVSEPQNEGEILHRGIARRAFERRFALADHVEVTGADMNNGLLRIAVRQIMPEALKPRRIPVQSGPSAPNNASSTVAVSSEARGTPSHPDLPAAAA